MPKIQYENESTVEEADPSLSILQISLKNQIPHVHACGGNARCSTCRILVLENPENLSARNEAEMMLTRKKGLEENIRLACQTKLRGDVKIRRLVLDQEDIQEVVAASTFSTGKEKKLAILFSDIRSFTPFAESSLPYDVVHALNRYFKKMGDCVIENGGIIDKYMGDGLMALFGVDTDDPEEACMSAVRAALAMLDGLNEVNRYVRSHINVEFKIGIGINYGEAIIGEIGHPEKKQFTALGDTVNIASRIESTTKKAGAPLLVSDSVYSIVKDHVKKGRSFKTSLKGKTGEFHVHELLTAEKDSRVQMVKPGGDESRFIFELPLVEQREIAEGTRLFKLDTREADFHFLPGQFIELGLPPSAGGMGESHFFSIASSPYRLDYILVATRMRPTPYKRALSKLEIGMRFRVTAPNGLWQLPSDKKERVVFFAGGIGITPVRAVMEDAWMENSSRDFTVFYSNRSLAQAAFLDDFNTWSKEMTTFKFISTVTTNDAAWTGEKGRIDSVLLNKHLKDATNAVFFLSGPETFVDSMRELLEALGVPKEKINQEIFAGY